MLAAMFHIAVGKRCGSEIHASKWLALLAHMSCFQPNARRFSGEGAVFVLIEFFTLLNRRGVSVPGMAKWALKVYDEILNLKLPLDHPAGVALTTCDRSEVPKPAKQAPMLELELILDLERLSIDRERTLGMRFYSSTYLLMVFASLRFWTSKLYLKYGGPERRSVGGRSTGN